MIFSSPVVQHVVRVNDVSDQIDVYRDYLAERNERLRELDAQIKEIHRQVEELTCHRDELS